MVGLYKSKVEFWILILVENLCFVESTELKLGFDYGFLLPSCNIVAFVRYKPKMDFFSEGRTLYWHIIMLSEES